MARIDICPNENIPQLLTHNREEYVTVDLEMLHSYQNIGVAAAKVAML